MMRSGLAVGGLCLWILAPASQGPAGNTAAPASMAFVEVLVTSADKDVVTPVSASDLELRVDGLVVPIQSFADAPSPTCVTLVDVSASVQLGSFQSPSQMLRVLDRGFFKSLAPADRIRLGAIANVLMWGGPFSSDAAVLRADARATLAVPEERRFGASPVWDAVDAAVTVLESEPGRRTIVLVTDGMVSGNTRSLTDVTVHAMLADVAVSVIGKGAPYVLPAQDGTAVRVRPDALLRTLADYTGGRFIADGRIATQPGIRPPDAEATSAAAFTRLLDDWHHTYVLGFAPTDLDGKVHTLAVRSPSPRLKVRARRDFRAPLLR